jgi:ParB/RepB/Spo0J family partition protein
MPINRPAEDVREISLASIDAPTFNPRRFDAADEPDLRSLSETLGQVGQLQNIVVRPTGKRFQVIAGERRYRAAKLADRKTITCVVRQCTEREAAEIQLVENANRKDLNPLETAVALKALCELGATSQSLAELLGIEERVIDGRLSLLSLPAEWQKRIRRGEINAAQAEYLIPWADRPAVLREMECHVGKDIPLSEWKHRLSAAVMLCSRSMDPAAPDGPHFELSEANVRRLEVISVEQQPGRFVKRSFAAGLWDSLQDDADGAADDDPEPDEAESVSDGRNGARHRAAAATRRISTNGRSATGGPAVNFGEPVSADDAESDFRARVVAWTAAYLRRLCCEAIEAAPVEDLPRLVETLGVDVASRWKVRRDFLELFSGRLEELAAELAVDVGMCQNDRERIGVLLASKPKLLPLAFIDALQPAAAATR